MKILTARQQAVLRYIERAEMPCTMREVAEDFNAPVSSVRSIFTTLERHGCIERLGVSMNGGVTWARPRDTFGTPLGQAQAPV